MVVKRFTLCMLQGEKQHFCKDRDRKKRLITIADAKESVEAASGL